MKKLFYTVKRATKVNDKNGNARYVINLFEYNVEKGLLLDRNNFLAGRLLNNKDGYIIKSYDVTSDLQAIFKDYKIIEVQ